MSDPSSKERFTPAYIAEVVRELESRGWQPDSRGDPECVDEASAAGADIIKHLQARLSVEPRDAVPPKDPREERLREAFLKCRQMLATQTGTFYNAAHFGLTPEDIGMERASVTKSADPQCGGTYFHETARFRCTKRRGHTGPCGNGHETSADPVLAGINAMRESRGLKDFTHDERCPCFSCRAGRNQR